MAMLSSARDDVFLRCTGKILPPCRTCDAMRKFFLNVCAGTLQWSAVIQQSFHEPLLPNWPGQHLVMRASSRKYDVPAAVEQTCPS
jgi:hypothetical protein